MYKTIPMTIKKIAKIYKRTKESLKSIGNITEQLDKSDLS